MKPRYAMALVLCTWIGSLSSAGSLLRGSEPPQINENVEQWLRREYASLEALYKHFHSHPELSWQEQETAKRIAQELQSAGCEVTERVGGYGVVGLLRNGEGPTVMVRADMDALPIVERTGAPYASQVRAVDREGRTVGVMHACGHDMNMTCLVGTARVLAAQRDRWKGTLMFVGQPAEEVGAGARAMLADGLFTRFPKPDCALALHCDGRYASGHVNYREGQLQANVDSVDILVRGKGGHGAAPHRTIDPIVIAARIVLDLQTIVSREVDPLESAVVTVGSIHGGTKHNIIPNEVAMQLTVRTTNDIVRKQVLASIQRIAKAAAAASNAPEPEVKIDLEQFTPALFNEPKLTRRCMSVARRVLGAEHVHERPMSLGGEDFSQFVLAGIPGCYFFLGTAPADQVLASQRPNGPPLRLPHTDQYLPVPEPTIKTGVKAMTSIVLELMGTADTESGR